MNQYYQLGVKVAALARRESTLKVNKRGKAKQKKTMYDQVGNQQAPYRYGQKVKKKDPSPPSDDK